MDPTAYDTKYLSKYLIYNKSTIESIMMGDLFYSQPHLPLILHHFHSLSYVRSQTYTAHSPITPTTYRQPHAHRHPPPTAHYPPPTPASSAKPPSMLTSLRLLRRFSRMSASWSKDLWAGRGWGGGGGRAKKCIPPSLLFSYFRPLF